MWVPAAITVCLLMPTGEVDCVQPQTQSGPLVADIESLSFDTEIECRYAGIFKSLQWTVTPPVSALKSITVECKKYEGEPV